MSPCLSADYRGSPGIEVRLCARLQLGGFGFPWRRPVTALPEEKNPAHKEGDSLIAPVVFKSAFGFMWMAKEETSSQDIMAPSVNILTELKSIKERLRAMEEVIHELRSENREQAIQLETLNASRCRMDEPLFTNRHEDIRVAFSAFLLDSTGPTNMGPFGSTTTLIYKHIFLNIGEGYNPNTGIFTAPLKGAYVFRVFSKGVGQTMNAMTAGLFKNGQHVFSTHAHQSGGFYSSSNGVSLLLEKGDTVSVHLYAGAWIFDNGEHHHSSFSGHLLFPL